jgi:hypothetical protein
MEKKTFTEEVIQMRQYLILVRDTQALEGAQKLRAYWWWFIKPKRWKCFIIRIREGMAYLPAFELTKRLTHKDIVAFSHRLTFTEFSKKH